tara:strand:- start:19671 stop:21266 length:1596 start_codon:yes stop_codon:yes gene_type:complete
MIENKKILLICKETFSYPLYFLGKELEKNNNEIHYFFVHNTDVTHKNVFNKFTYFYFKERIKDKYLHDVKDLNIEFFKQRKNIHLDYNRLKEIEKKYTFFKGLNNQILSSQMTSTPYHDRYFYPKSTYEENCYWLLLNYNKTEELLNSIEPDYIFDIGTEEIQRTIINEVANYKKIPYISIESTRYETFIIPTFNLGLQLDQYFLKAYESNKNQINSLHEYIDEVKNYRAKTHILSDKFQDLMDYSHSFTLGDMLKYILIKTYRYALSGVQDFIKKKKYMHFNSPIDGNSFKKILWHYNYAFRKFLLNLNMSSFFKAPAKEKYAFMPLHLIPESTTFVKAPMYVNELNNIQAVAKSLPIDWKLYVKEHPAMIGERNLNFYRNVNKIPNVKLVTSNYYEDPKTWIENSAVVITIAGTSAFEATMLNIPAMVFGNVSYNVLSNIKLVKSFNELESLFNLIESNSWLKDNTIECAAYLKTISEVGVNLDYNQLIKLASKKIHSEPLEKQEKEDFVVLLNCLINFFEKAVSIKKQ